MHKINPSAHDSVSGGNSLMQKQSSVYILNLRDDWEKKKILVH